MLSKNGFIQGLLIVFMFSTTICVYATDIQNNIGGGNWTLAGSPYRIVGNCTLRTGQTLNVEAGVQIRFQGNYQFIISGRITLGDTAGYQVLITSDAATYPGITFFNSNYQNSFQNVRIQNAARGIKLENSGYLLLINTLIESPTQYGIECNESNVVCDNVTILNAGMSGIRVNGGQLTAFNSDISNCGDHGVQGLNGASLALTNCSILNNNDDGVRNTNSGTVGSLSLNNCEISDNGVYGIYATGLSTATIHYVSTVINGSHGVFLQNANNVDILRLTSSGNGIGPNMGSGLFLFSCNVNINSSTFDFNRSWGIYAQSSTMYISYCNFFQNTSGNITGGTAGVSPLYVNPLWQSTSGTIRYPSRNSPLIDQGSPAITRDPDRTRADVGHHYYNQNRPPYFISRVPPDSVIQGVWGNNILFQVTYGDSDATDTVRVRWYVNSILQGHGSTFTLPSVRASGIVDVVLDDFKPAGQTSFRWTVYVGVDEPKVPNQFSSVYVSPNPTNGWFRIQANNVPDGKIVLYDANGRVVQSVNFIAHNRQLDQTFFIPSILPSGRYWIVLPSKEPVPIIFLK
ncbi:MAG: right-handed parallel beta-helix repeat-containing protein [bacterium]|nr:right-handed parallel beta-helix repeat-containing protein [bacterium]